MIIQRDKYLNKIISSIDNGFIKIITGVRRCGKSYLLFNLFRSYLMENNVDEQHIIEMKLDDYGNKEFRHPKKLYEYVKERIIDNEKYYILLDEIQLVDEFEDVLNGFLHIENADVYVTGSNSKFLSTDVITQFRGRGYEIRIYPLNFSEFISVYDGNQDDAWHEYYTFGGMPLTLSFDSDAKKSNYLKQLLKEVYLVDVKERNKIRNDSDLEELLVILASAVGSLTNPRKLENTFHTLKKSEISAVTIKKYLDYLTDSFLIDKAVRYDVKGKKYISTPLKYYFVDIGLRNAELNFRQQEENHIMENIIFNELKCRDYNIDVGTVEINVTDDNGKHIRKQLEVDFIAHKGNNKYYIQSALSLPDAEKKKQEERPLLNIDDSFKKIIVVGDYIKLKRDDNGITTINIREFLLKENSLDL